VYNFYLWVIHLRIDFTVVRNNVQKKKKKKRCIVAYT